MTLYQFKLLDQSDQIKEITEKAVYLIKRIDGDYTYKLYQLDTVYIEEQWHTKFNERRALTSFIGDEKLTPYLDCINVELELYRIREKN